MKTHANLIALWSDKNWITMSIRKGQLTCLLRRSYDEASIQSVDVCFSLSERRGSGARGVRRFPFPLPVLLRLLAQVRWLWKT